MNRKTLSLTFALVLSSAVVLTGCPQKPVIIYRSGPTTKPPRIEVPGTETRGPSVTPPVRRTPTRTRARVDQRLRRALDALRIKYSVTRTGTLKAVYNMGSNRSETVYLMSKTQRYGSVEVREIYAIGLQSRGRPFNQRVMGMLLMDTEKNKLGGWQVGRSSSGLYSAYFSVRVNANLYGTQLRSVILMVLRATQSMKKKFGI